MKKKERFVWVGVASFLLIISVCGWFLPNRTEKINEPFLKSGSLILSDYVVSPGVYRIEEDLMEKPIRGKCFSGENVKYNKNYSQFQYGTWFWYDYNIKIIYRQK